jgi:DNA-binding NtrC family response regulator
MSLGDRLELSSFPDHIQESILDKEEGWSISLEDSDLEGGLDYSRDKERFEREFIVRALKANQGRINQTCEKARIPKNTLLRKMKKYGIQARDDD